MSENITVKVSGSEIYKAVKNYLNNSDHLKKLVEDQVKAYVDKGLMNQTIERVVRSKLDTTYYSNPLKEVITQIVNQEVKNKINEYVLSSVKTAFTESVFVVPRADK
jgi:hypothetical protein